METSLPLFCEEDEESCRDVNNSLPPVVERGVDHEGMSHARCGGGGGEGIKRRSFLCSWKFRVRVPVEVLCKEFELKSPVKRIPF